MEGLLGRLKPGKQWDELAAIDRRSSRERKRLHHAEANETRGEVRVALVDPDKLAGLDLHEVTVLREAHRRGASVRADIQFTRRWFSSRSGDCFCVSRPLT